MSRFTEIETFVSVVEAGSLSGAARRLGIAVSAVSRRIGELETRLGVRLANRSTRGFATTALGQDYYDNCLRLLADLADADAGVSGERASLTGLVRIAAPLSFGVRHLGPILNAYAAERSQLRFELDLSDRKMDIVEEGFDLAIRIGELADSSLIAKRLFRIHHVVAASPDFWNEHGRPAHPHDLTDLPALTYRIGNDPALWHYTSSQNKGGQVRLAPRYITTNGDFSIAAAVAGLGVTLEPTFLCAEELQNGKLEAVLPDYRWFDMSAYAVWPPGRPLPLRARQLIDYLVISFVEPTPWDMLIGEHHKPRGAGSGNSHGV